MTANLVALMFAVMAVIAAVRPRAGAVLLWFAVWLYPGTLMYGLLPLSIRLSDLFVAHTFLVCLLFGLRRLHYVLRGTTIKLAVAWFVVQLVGNVSGVLFSGERAPLITITRFVAKAMYVPMTVFILSSVLRNRDDVQRNVRWLCVAGVAVALLGIATVYFPRQFEGFLVPSGDPTVSIADRLEAVSGLSRRAAGSVGNAGTALILLNISLLALSNWLFRQKGARRRVHYAAYSILCAIGLAYTQCRGAMLAFLASFAWGLFRSRRKLAFGLLLLLGLLALTYERTLHDVVFARFTGATGSTFASGMSTRTRVWDVFIRDFSPIFLLTGIGMSTSFSVYHATAHSAYLGALVYGGIPGAALLIAIVVSAWRLATGLLARRDDGMALAAGTYLRMLVIAMLVVGFVAENFQNTICMQLFFAGMLLAERALGPPVNVRGTRRAAVRSLAGVRRVRRESGLA